jgi:hypothetical protein
MHTSLWKYTINVVLLRLLYIVMSWRLPITKCKLKQGICSFPLFQRINNMGNKILWYTFLEQFILLFFADCAGVGHRLMALDMHHDSYLNYTWKGLGQACWAGRQSDVKLILWTWRKYYLWLQATRNDDILLENIEICFAKQGKMRFENHSGTDVRSTW